MCNSTGDDVNSTKYRLGEQSEACSAVPRPAYPAPNVLPTPRVVMSMTPSLRASVVPLPVPMTLRRNALVKNWFIFMTDAWWHSLLLNSARQLLQLRDANNLLPRQGADTQLVPSKDSF